MEFKAGIVDDEKNAREFISLLLENEFPEVKIVFEAKTVEEFDEALRQHTPDILYLDIQLKNKLIFESKLLKRSEAAKIYISAYSNYGINAIKTRASDYLIKPINQLEFINATRKVINQKLLQKKTEEAETTRKRNSDHIDVPTSTGYLRLKVSEIIRCESNSNYTIIMLINKAQIVVSKTISEFETHLYHYGFCRVHQSHLINLTFFKEYIKGKGGVVVLSDQSRINVAVRKKKDLLDMLSILNRRM